MPRFQSTSRLLVFALTFLSGSMAHAQVSFVRGDSNLDQVIDVGDGVVSFHRLHRLIRIIEKIIRR